VTKREMQAEALERARASQALTNYPAIYQGFVAKGIAEADIKPRENVFTFNAWKALGRSVCRGEHGVRVVTFIDCSANERDPASGEEKTVSYRRPHTTTVFHVSQTEPTAERDARVGAMSGEGSQRAMPRAVIAAHNGQAGTAAIRHRER
jgi:antirestriction protein ArdC